MMRPTSVEPVKAILSTPSWPTIAAPVVAVAGDDVDDARRQAGLAADLGEQQRRERRELGRLEHHRVAGRQRRRDLPGQHQQREVPRDDLAADAERPWPGKLFLQQLGPAGVMVEVARRERHVDVARLADRLAVVHRLEHGEEALVLLQVPGDGVEIAGALVAGQGGPAGEGARARPSPPCRRRHRCRTPRRASSRRSPGCHGEGRVARLGEAAVDEVADARACRRAASHSRTWALLSRRRPVFHGP
jgi:hypothetical protein